jgi:Arabinose-binding domain of AraC transcription regulator, N-term
LLRRAGLSQQDFGGPQQRISAASLGTFLEYAAEAMDDSAFGLHLAAEANPREAGESYSDVDSCGWQKRRRQRSMRRNDSDKPLRQPTSHS